MHRDVQSIFDKVKERDPNEHEFLQADEEVFDSLGDVVGVVELSALHPASRSPAPAWS